LAILGGLAGVLAKVKIEVVRDVEPDEGDDGLADDDASAEKPKKSKKKKK
jgi:hypothetical protein